ncbi:response regulator [Scytonema tolypothrichoides VB-61278]|nr:response regulator [Scytonema tolypothrichoides VB-61278]
MPPDVKAIVPEDIFIGDSEMARLMRTHDWSATPLGPINDWSGSLRTAVNICLNSRFPMVIWWGKELVMLYNDAWRPILGSKHPRALGRPGQEFWQENWDIIGAQLNGVLATGKATWADDLLLPTNRHGYLEEAYYTYSYSPIFLKTGEVGGVFTAVADTTERVLGERRTKTLRDLAAQVVQAKTAEQASRMGMQTLSENPADIPFALLYLLDTQGSQAVLQERTPFDIKLIPAPECVDLTQKSTDSPWSLVVVVQSGQAVLLENLVQQLGEVPAGLLQLPLQQALVLPIRASGQDTVMGMLVMGVNPSRALDEDYRNFFEMTAGQIASAIANARAYEEERKRAEALAELDRAKTTFFSNISHEFRTPLTLMLGPLEDILANSSELQPSEREQLETVHRNSLRLLKLVNTLLDFSRIEADRIQAVYEPTDLALLTADLAGVFRSAIERAGMRLLVDCPPLPELVYVDWEMWEKILLNLLSNAFKFTFEGEIAVVLRDRDDHIELEVRDTGTGIPANELPHIFKRFHRVHGAKGRSYEGSGIGLSLVQELVRLHNGTIEVSSVVNQGTRFTVSIPTGYAHLPSDSIDATRTLASTAMLAATYVQEALRWLPDVESTPARRGGKEFFYSTSSGSPKSPVCPASGARILLADDNADMRDYVKRLLSQCYEVQAVADGVAALAAIGEQIPDLVLTDVMMPEMDGFELLRSLRADPQTRELPIIMLSARAGEESRIEGLEAGADDYLIKPFSARELLARVEANLKMTWLRQKAARRVAAQYAVARVVAEATTLSDAVPVILQSLCENLGWQLGILWTVDRQTNSLRQVNHWHVPTIHVQKFIQANQQTTLTPGVGLPGGVWASGQPLWICDLAADDNFPNAAFAATEGLRGVFGFPIVLNNEVLGVISCFNTQIQAPDPELLQIVAAIGTQLGQFIERKRAESALQQSEHKYRRIVETASEGIWIIDAQTRTTYVNPQMAQILGYTPEDMLGRCLFEFIYDADRSQAQRYLQRGQQGIAGQFEFCLRRKDGTPVWILSNTSPMLNENGEFIGALAMVTDISDRKQAEVEREELLQREQAARVEAETANRIKDEFLAVLSHELRSPLNPILGWSKILQTRKLDQLQTNQALSVIERNAKLQSELIEDLLDVSRILQGKLSLNVCPIDLVTTIEAAMETVRLAAEAKSIQIQTVLEPNVGQVAGDSSRLQQVIWNLLSNAVKFTDVGGRVDIRLERLGSQAQITVSDTGKGIHPKFLPHVFEYFRQADAATTRKFGGLGLGLAIVRHLVELHGGTVRADSLGEGKGAYFTIQLPLMSTPPKRNQDTRASEQSLDLHGIKILVVDDDADTRDFVAYLLEMYGASVTTVASAIDALTSLTTTKPDLLLSDIGMPEMDGYTLMRQVRTLPPDEGGQILAIALTAYAGEIDYQQAISAGFQKHISKPVDPARLVEAIANLVGRGN